MSVLLHEDKNHAALLQGTTLYTEESHLLSHVNATPVQPRPSLLAKALDNPLLNAVIVHSTLLICCVIWGAWAVVAKYTISNFPAIVLLSLRWSIASIVLYLALAISNRQLPRIPEWSAMWRIVVLAVIGVYTQQLLFIYGLDRTTSSNTAILQMIIPPVTTFFSLLLGLERTMWEKILGVTCAVLGSLVLLGIREMQWDTQVLGNLLVCCSSISSSFYLLWGRPIWASHGSLMVAAWAFGLAYVDRAIAQQL
jgi:drug/metabolite transporter (DMT)-like permease